MCGPPKEECLGYEDYTPKDHSARFFKSPIDGKLHRYPEDDDPIGDYWSFIAGD